MGNIIQAWMRNIFDRRTRGKINPHSQLDHPERCSSNESSTITEIQPTSNEAMSTRKTTGIKETGGSTKCSKFYIACRTNNIDEVKRLLKRMTLDEVDRIEPNGSTALHSASYHGHGDIVKLLLEAGADRAIPNKFQYLPYDEAKNDEIKQLFVRIPNRNRLVSNTGNIEWDSIGDDALEKAVEERKIIKSIYDTTDIKKMFEKIKKNYIDKDLTHFEGIDNIKRFFDKAIEEQDPKWIIKAYTAETDFYKILNTDIACGTSKYLNERRYIITLLMHHPKLTELSYIGKSYRFVEMNIDELKKYEINSSLMTKSFVSSSIDRKIPELFLYQKETIENENAIRKTIDGLIIKTWIMFIYHIKHQRTALYIENISQYANEGEVLIMPYSVFQIKKIKQIKVSYLLNEPSITEIELEEFV